MEVTLLHKRQLSPKLGAPISVFELSRKLPKGTSLPLGTMVSMTHALYVQDFKYTRISLVRPPISTI